MMNAYPLFFGKKCKISTRVIRMRRGRKPCWQVRQSDRKAELTRLDISEYYNTMKRVCWKTKNKKYLAANKILTGCKTRSNIHARRTPLFLFYLFFHRQGTQLFQRFIRIPSIFHARARTWTPQTPFKKKYIQTKHNRIADLCISKTSLTRSR